MTSCLLLLWLLRIPNVIFLRAAERGSKPIGAAAFAGHLPV
jgi:hypothetical protein